MAEPERNTYEYRILRYAPNLLRVGWVNIGVLLESADGGQRGVRILDEEHLPRVRRLHPDADLDLLCSLHEEFRLRLAGPPESVAKELAKWNGTLSNALQLGPTKGLLAEDFETELARLYDEQVGPPPRARGDWRKAREAGWAAS